MIHIDQHLTPEDLLPAIDRMWSVSGTAIRSLQASWDPEDGSPVLTMAGQYTTRGWTEWTEGFQYGSALLQFEAVQDEEFLEIGRQGMLGKMATHVTHAGVHDHGFNNISTYGHYRRLMLEGTIPLEDWSREFCELALRCSGVIQASRWTRTSDGRGFIYSFNGPHSLFCDTIRSLRSLAMAFHLGHRMMAENDREISLLQRLLDHAHTTARHNVYYGGERDLYDVRGRVAHESLFNPNDGRYRCPSTQQGYSPFSTWTRGLAWIMLGYAEQLEFLQTVPDGLLEEQGGRDDIEELMLDAARAACDYYLETTPTDGVPYWDTGAPGLAHLPEHASSPADPFNDHEPVDSSAAAIAAQGLLRLGRLLQDRGHVDEGTWYFQAGLTTLRTLLGETYLSLDSKHQGLLLHSVYHRPRGWDFIPEGHSIPCHESSQWGDYHLREAALLVQRIARNQRDYTFFGPVD